MPIQNGIYLIPSLHGPNALTKATMHLIILTEKMRSGVPLSDEDRWPWLDAIAVAIADIDSR